MTSQLICAIDQGTSSSRFSIFDLHMKKVVAYHQEEIKRNCPKTGWVEICPNHIYQTVLRCVEQACEKLSSTNYLISQIVSCGLTNQRETTILWDAYSGQPLYNAIVWLDCRTADLADEFIRKTPTNSKDYLRSTTGLPIHSYFSALKIRWLIDNVDAVGNSLRNGTLLFGTVDTWLMWKLTGMHVTDITNASRTMLMDLHTGKWSQDLCDFFGIPISILPVIRSSAEVYSVFPDGPLKGIKLSGMLGDQQAAMLGESCNRPGDIKCTFGTGTFILCNVGNKPVISESGLLSSVGYKLGANALTTYIIEGSGSLGGSAIRFLRENLSIFQDAREVTELANSVEDTGGVIFVPSFSGLFSPYWDTSVRGTLFGLAQSTTKGHIVRAALEAICCQAAELFDAVNNDVQSAITIGKFKIDGNLTSNFLFNQLLSDVIGRSVSLCSMYEATSWGAALSSAIGADVISACDLERYTLATEASYNPKISSVERLNIMKNWRDAIRRILNWSHKSSGSVHENN